MCIRTTDAWSWPVTLRRSWTAGRRLCYRLESIPTESLLVLWPFLEPKWPNLHISATQSCRLLAETLAVTPFSPLVVFPPLSLPAKKEKVPHPFHLTLSFGSSTQHSWSMMSHQYVCVFSSVSNQKFFTPSPFPSFYPFLLNSLYWVHSIRPRTRA